MADWKRKLNLLPEWDMAKEGKITTAELATSVADKIRNLEPFPEEHRSLNEELELIEFDFREAGKDPDLDVDDFDSLMDTLYDWADTPLDDKWNGAKACWIMTF
jgi:hypothetical protein